MIYYVNAAAAREGDGSKERPFRRINEAAKVAAPGDEVLVAPGIYREYVDPVNGGTEDARITYRSEQPLGAVITGAEPVDSWEPYQGNVWVCRIDNGVFAVSYTHLDVYKRQLHTIWQRYKEQLYWKESGSGQVKSRRTSRFWKDNKFFCIPYQQIF